MLFSIASLGSMVANLSLSVMFKRLRIRTILLIGTFCYVVFFAVAATADSLAMLYVGAAVFGLGVAWSGFAVIQPIITWWFVRGVGKKIGYASIAYPIVALVLSPVVAWSMQTVGQTTTLVVHGIVCLILMLVASQVLISERPESYGLVAYDSSPEDKTAVVQEAEGSTQVTGLTLRQAMKTGPFWLLMIAAFLAVGFSTGYSNQAAAIYGSIGLSAIVAATMISVNSVAAIVWNFLYGALSDRLDGIKSSLVFGVVCAIFCAVAAVVGGTSGGIFIAVAIAATQFGGMYAALVLPSVFGVKDFGSVLAVANVFTAIGGAVAGAAGGVIYDMTQSYTGYFAMFAVAMALMVILHALATTAGARSKVTQSVVSPSPVGARRPSLED